MLKPLVCISHVHAYGLECVKGYTSIFINYAHQKLNVGHGRIGRTDLKKRSCKPNTS
ncbi:uncharacterized protein LOC143174769 isoform X3 [Nomia melanderi]|uniref:uncharacterized protein LOC143174769 isoform X3 n=1 Tax=Nomia melanderi TaxID=2448451 RepID=UPI003FCD0A96